MSCCAPGWYPRRLGRYLLGIRALDAVAAVGQSRLRIGVLGPLEIDDESARLGSRDRIVLAALAMHPGEMLSLEQLADAVWGDEPPPSWSKNLQGCISRLRKLLGPELIETAGRATGCGCPPTPSMPTSSPAPRSVRASC